MSARSTVLAVSALAAPLPALATRVPGDGVATVASAVLAVLLAGLSLASAFRPAWRWTPPSAVAAGVGLLAVPASHDALLALPAVLVALPVLFLFHRLYPLDADDAVLVGSHGSNALHAVLRMAPLAGLLVLLAVLPWLAGVLLPDRLASTRELRGPLVALATALLLAALLATSILVRAAATALRRRRAAEAAAPPTVQEAA